MSDTIEGRPVLWRWEVPPDQYTEDQRLRADIADEYAIVEAKSATGIAVRACGGGEWFKPWSSQPVVAELLLRLQESEARATYLLQRLKGYDVQPPVTPEDEAWLREQVKKHGLEGR